MAAFYRHASVVLLACALSACHGQAQDTVAESIAPQIVAVQAAIAEVVPQPIEPEAIGIEPLPPAPTSVVKESHVTSDLIIKWEIGSPALYTKRYQRPEWPGGASGITIGVGDDLCYKSSRQIKSDWAIHPDLNLLTTAAGICGQAAKIALPRYRGIVTPYTLAESVFRTTTLPQYAESARRALGPKFEQLDDGDGASLKSMGYNRGWSMIGTRNSEKRVIRDECVPQLDTACIAAQLRSMKRLWPTVKGLRDRREDEAVTAETK